MENSNNQELRAWIKEQAQLLGFSEMRVSDLDVSQAMPYLQDWLEKGHHGDMYYMSQQAHLRANPKEILPQAIRILSFRMEYLPKKMFENGDDWRANEWAKIHNPESAIVSVYARGRDYHKVLRARLQELAKKIESKLSTLHYRVAVDSVPLFEVEIAKKSGLAWRGKHTLALHRDVGSMFFLGEILIDVPLTVDEPISDHCGQCSACIDICPTQAIKAPYQLEAKRCISYLTIEHKGSIPIDLRTLIGNRIYGCDDCQLICPWNKFAMPSKVGDFDERHHLGNLDLIEVFSWDQNHLENLMRGSAIYRIGYAQLKAKEVLRLQYKKINDLVDEHIQWALNE